ncbi:unnamed protein product [Cochlearia groenlandica]
MGCLISPVMKLRCPSSAESRLFSYRKLAENLEDSVIKVVVGKEKKEFMVEPYVLEEYPFKVLIGSVKDGFKNRFNRTGKVVWLDHVDSILFEHFLWLYVNDVSTFWDIDVAEMIDFYAQDC